jgi:toxin ParE1/3/4
MIYSLKLQAEAIIDLQEAFEWYENKSFGLGFEFIEEVQSAYEKICNHPQHYSAVNNRYRKLKINRFPYLIIFEIENANVIVVSVLHTSKSKKIEKD